MSELASILEELNIIQLGEAWHGPALLESLDGLTAQQAAAKPLTNAHSIWEIVLHITGWENVFRRRLEGDGQAAEPDAGDFPLVGSTEQDWSDSVNSLKAEHAKLLEVVSSLTDEALEKNVAQREYSVRFLLKGIVRHHVYHTGQIGILRKALA